MKNHAKVVVTYLDSETLTPQTVSCLAQFDGILVPGGFGVRGVDGKVEAIRYAREKKMPFLGICLGLQCAVIEAARNIAGLPLANSSEFDPATPDPVIDILPEQKEIEKMGGTMRLGLYPCRLDPSSKAFAAYAENVIFERHRHRYEVNNRYRTILKQAGMVFSGLSPDERLVEVVERTDHPWFVASQYHPEFKSRPNKPHPLFRDFVGAALQQRHQRETAKNTLTAAENLN
jgi:CTP synthase